ncbi:MAG: 4-hydroxythreonine-4-phosphate dehydrogenase PdxA [bacterium]|nr:4-hydroxythreonine-4-phosphate dehydrogenase PdxA [Gammaproteobacteria bacterium]HIL95774.1 4-hydroxythreonine-4-phosphate dehydrogenase PdxA [Pseudomonadales bacterium]
MSSKPTLAITPGEPAGIGPDIALLLKKQDLGARLVLVADPGLMQQRAQLLGLPTPDFHICNHQNDILDGHINIIPVKPGCISKPGELNPSNANYVLQCLDTAVQLCESGACQALVTGPVNKAIINEAGIAFTGHTEWLAKRTNTSQVVMMLATRNLRVALATTHLPLREVADAIQYDSLLTTLDILHRDLRNRFNIANPRIIVCGLNPHAGENGHLGHEELDIIIPALEDASKSGINVTGPIPADTAFTPASLRETDAVLAMYHDQGLPVLKHQGFGDAVNITLGLPIIRTSVDHGTALDLAGTGKADPASLNTAIRYAIDLASRNH